MAPSATITVEGLIKDASAKIEQKNTLTEQVAGVREMLRFLDKAGQTNKEESAWIAKAFPARKKGEEGADENAAAAE